MTLVPHITEIHVEPTTVCQAECPMCPRTILGYHRGQYTNSELTLDIFKTHLDPLVDRLQKVLFCGTLGEPAAAQDLIPMIRWLKTRNSSITIGLNSNGGVRATAWWAELASLIKDDIRSYVVFSIDGLEDTNHIYRKNVSWSKLMDNARAYISSGGNAQWDSLIFKHNQHQVNQMRDLAKELGFKIFRTKISSRDSTDGIYPPESGKPQVSSKTFACMAETTASLYLSAQGLWYPCCYIHHHSVLDVNDWGQPLNNVSDREVAWSDLEYRLYTPNKPKICDRSCGSSYNSGQWTHEESF